MDASQNTAQAPTVLVVEDDWVVRGIIHEILETEGFGVVAVETADEAWAYLRDHAEKIALIFSDIRMPGELSGIDLANLARQHWPQLPIILSSGYSGEYRLDAGALATFLAKPWHSRDIGTACRRAIAAVDPGILRRATFGVRSGAPG